MNHLAHHTDSLASVDPEYERSSLLLGMWLFLATEVLFFGGLFVAYIVYRYEYHEAFVAGSQHLNLWSGGAMTGILLLGSLLVAIADHRLAGPHTDRRSISPLLLVTSLLGLAFLGLEFHEYQNLITEGLFPAGHFRHGAFAGTPLSGRSAEMFFVLFFCMTGLHALHMLIGISLVTGVAAMLFLSNRASNHRNTLSVVALYWHFVDIVWIFLYPFFYLVS